MLIGVNPPEMKPRQPKVGLQFEGFAEVLRRLVEFALLREQDSQVVVCIGVTRIGGDRPAGRRLPLASSGAPTARIRSSDPWSISPQP